MGHSVFLALLSATVIAAGSGYPSLAAEPYAEELESVRSLVRNAKALGYCQAIGFRVDQDALNGKLDSLMTRLANAELAEGRLDVTLHEAAALGQTEVPDLVIPELSQGSEIQAFQAFEGRFQRVQERCDALIKDPEIISHMSRGPYQAMAGSKSYFGLIAYQASLGDTEKMVTLGALYAMGIKADPNHKIEVMWYKKAADKGHPKAAARLAGAYFLGRGAKQDMVEAVKWAIIAESLGGGSFERENIEPSVTPAQRRLGQKQALAWLNAYA